MKIGIIAAALAFVGLSAVAQTNQKTNMDMKKLELVQEWDKTFPKSDKVEHSKVYGHEIEMYTIEQGEKRDKRQ